MSTLRQVLRSLRALHQWEFEFIPSFGRFGQPLIRKHDKMRHPGEMSKERRAWKLAQNTRAAKESIVIENSVGPLRSNFVSSCFFEPRFELKAHSPWVLIEPVSGRTGFTPLGVECL